MMFLRSPGYLEAKAKAQERGNRSCEDESGSGQNVSRENRGLEAGGKLKIGPFIYSPCSPPQWQTTQGFRSHNVEIAASYSLYHHGSFKVL